VFYADAQGVIHRLSPDGQAAIVATFPITDGSRQELSFAVSPDGRDLVASVLTTPPHRDPRYFGDSVFVEGGHWTLELFRAGAGGAAVSTFSHDLGAQVTPPAPMVVVGWDRHGPLATLNTVLATQGAPASLRFAGSALVHIGPDGTPQDHLGGQACQPLDELPDSTTLCSAGTAVRAYEVRDAAGTELWQRDLTAVDWLYPYLSPDASAIAASAAVLTKSGSTIALGAPPVQSSVGMVGQFRAEGWLDDHTVIGAVTQAPDLKLGNLQVVDVAHPTELHQLPFDGNFIGVL
jgi:hypothetical protein